MDGRAGLAKGVDAHVWLRVSAGRALCVTLAWLGFNVVRLWPSLLVLNGYAHIGAMLPEHQGNHIGNGSVVAICSRAYGSFDVGLEPKSQWSGSGSGDGFFPTTFWL